MNLELHADDLGATPGVNRRIIACWRQGALDGVSVLANGDALEEAAAAVNADADRPLRIVAHLNLSEARPVADTNEVPLLVGDDGILRYGFLGLWIEWLKRSRAGRAAFEKEIEREWRAQIERVRDVIAPRRVSAVDGHIHVHMLPFTFPIAARLAEEFGIDEVRISAEVRHFSLRDTFRVGCIANVIKHQLLRTLAGRARKLAAISGLNAPDSVAGLLYSGRMTASAIRAAERAARRRGHDWLEIISHPGRAAPEDASRWETQPGLGAFYLSPDRDVEFDALLDVARQREAPAGSAA